MVKPIFENEDQFIALIRDTIPFLAVALYEKNMNVKFNTIVVSNAKVGGYIKKDILGIVREAYKNYNPNDNKFDEHHILIETMWGAITYLEKQLEEKKWNYYNIMKSTNSQHL